MNDSDVPQWVGRVFNGWTVGPRLGRGGNGVVYSVSRGAETAAIKFLHPRHWGEVRGGRFAHEVEAMRLCRNVPGVLPVLDANVPAEPTGDNPPWFVMPLATPLEEQLGKQPTLEQVVETCLAVARTLTALHELGVSHRDIKPSNILFHDDVWVLGDLGLADYPGKPDLTETGEQLGPRNYVAPEMTDAKHVADARPADVYSFAKLLWTLATWQNRPLPGWHGPFEATSLSGNLAAPHSRAFRLEPIIDRATRLNPAERPSMKDVMAQLELWLTPVRPWTVAAVDLSGHRSVIQAAAEKAAHAREAAEGRVQREDQERKRIFAALEDVIARSKKLLSQSGFTLDPYYSLVYGTGQRGYVRTDGPQGRIALIFRFSAVILGKLNQCMLSGACAVCPRYDAQHDQYGYGQTTDSRQVWSGREQFLLGSSDEEHALNRLSEQLYTALIGAIAVVARLISEPES